jgi:hypothetical protein
MAILILYRSTAMGVSKSRGSRGAMASDPLNAQQVREEDVLRYRLLVDPAAGVADDAHWGEGVFMEGCLLP